MGRFARLVPVSLAIVAFDVLVMQQYLWSFGGLLVLAVAAGVRSAGRDRWPVALGRVAVPVGGMVLAIGLIVANSLLAQSRAASVVAAVERYHADCGVFPERLEELVPEYLPSVPRAKVVLLFGDFDYWTFDGEHELMWTGVPPFDRHYYRFEERRWYTLD